MRLEALWLVIVVAVAAAVAAGSFAPGPSYSCASPCPKVDLGIAQVTVATCSSATGVCEVALFNNSTAAAQLESCEFSFVLSSNKTVTVRSQVAGYIGGAAADSMPAGSGSLGTCTMPYSQLRDQAQIGTAAMGSFVVKLLQNWQSYPAGTESSFEFFGNWV